MSTIASQITRNSTVCSNCVQANIKANIKVRVTGPLWGPVIGGFPSQRTSNAENVSIWWRHHVWARILSACAISMSKQFSKQNSIAIDFQQPYGPLARYAKLRVAHAPGMPGTFSPPPRISDSDMHHGTCVTHVPWCMPGSLTCGFLWSR